MARTTPPILHPRYWPTCIGLGLWWLVIQLPRCWQLALGRQMGRLVMKRAKRRQHIVERNVALCFPELSPEEQARMVRANMDSTMMALFENVMAWFWPKWRLRKLCTLEGIEHLEQAKAENQGVVLLAMHFTHLDLGAKLLSMQHSIDGLYRPHRNPVYDWVQRRGRERNVQGGFTIHSNDIL